MHRLQAAQTHPSPAEIQADQVNFPGMPKTICGGILAPEAGNVPHIPIGGVKKMRVFEDDVGLAQGDLAQLRLLWDRLDQLAARAKRNGSVTHFIHIAE